MKLAAALTVLLVAAAFAGCSEKSSNHPPEAVLGAFSAGQALVPDAGGALRVDEGTLLRFDGSSSRDPDGDALQYEWRLQGPADAAASAGRAATFEHTFGAGTHTVTLVVSDGKLSDQASVRVVAAAVAPPPPPPPPPPAQVFNETFQFDLSGHSDDVTATVPASGVRLEFTIVQRARAANTQTTLTGELNPDLSQGDPHVAMTPPSGGATFVELEAITAGSYGEAGHEIESWTVTLLSPAAGEWTLGVKGVGQNVDVEVKALLAFA